jgi:hypothetical protein
VTRKETEKQGNNANVEFGVELGDMNASKMFEIPFMNEDKGKKGKKNENKTG